MGEEFAAAMGGGAAPVTMAFGAPQAAIPGGQMAFIAEPVAAQPGAFMAQQPGAVTYAANAQPTYTAEQQVTRSAKIMQNLSRESCNNPSPVTVQFVLAYDIFCT